MSRLLLNFLEEQQFVQRNRPDFAGSFSGAAVLLNRLLVITLRDFQVKMRMLLIHSRATMASSTAIAHQHVAHDSVQEHIDQCCNHQDNDRGDGLVPGPGNTAERGRGCHHRQPECRREVLLPPEIFAATDTAAANISVAKVLAAFITPPGALLAAYGGRFRLRNGHLSTLAGRALENNMSGHGRNSL